MNFFFSVSTLFLYSSIVRADDDGGRPFYHYPDPTDTYLPDSLNPLKRELWRVFEKEDGTAYIIPRPDGLGLIYYPLCVSSEEEGQSFPYFLVDGGEQDHIYEQAQQYGLCDEVVTDVININSIPPEIALNFTNIFHRNLEFTVDENGSDVVPFAPPDDVLLACDSLINPSTEVQEYCADLQEVVDTGIEIALVPSKRVSEALVTALNALYDVKNDADSCDPSNWGEDWEEYNCPIASCVTPSDESCILSTNYIIFINGPGESLRTCCNEPCYFIHEETGERCLESGIGSILRMFWIQFLSIVTLLVSLMNV